MIIAMIPTNRMNNQISIQIMDFLVTVIKAKQRLQRNGSMNSCSEHTSKLPAESVMGGASFFSFEGFEGCSFQAREQI